MSLDLKTDDELRTTLKSLGYPVRGKMKRETMIAHIMKLQATPKAIPEKIKPVLSVIGQTEAPAPKKNNIGGCSQEEVLEMLKDNIARGMTVTFHENSWQFTRGIRSDSGTMSQPIYNIKKCADLVCAESIPAARIGLTKSLIF